MKKFYILFIMGCLSIQLLAQDKDSTKDMQFKLSSEYLSNYLYNGRADSLRSPYATTTFEVKKGEFTLSASSYLLLQQGNQRFDYFEIDGSYEHDFTDKISGGLYASKYINSNQRSSINSDITSSIGSSLTYDLHIFKLSTESDLLFSNKTDVYLNFELEKEIKKEFNAGTFTIDPTIDLNFSTTNYYESTITKNALKKNKKLISSTTTNIVNTTKVLQPGLRLMDYEIALPFSYETKHIGFSFTPTFVIPMNPVKTSSTLTTNGIATTIDSTPYDERFLKNTIFTNCSIYYKF